MPKSPTTQASVPELAHTPVRLTVSRATMNHCVPLYCQIAPTPGPLLPVRETAQMRDGVTPHMPEMNPEAASSGTTGLQLDPSKCKNALSVEPAAH